MLFTSMILLTLGYTMVFSALHGNWAFWLYLFPATAPTGSLAATG